MIKKVLSIIMIGVLTSIGYNIGDEIIDKYYEIRRRKNIKICHK